MDAAIGAGFIVPSIDGDGVLRSAPIVQRYGDEIYPSLSLAVGMAYMFLDDIDLTIRDFAQNLEMISKIQFVDKEIFTDFKGRVHVPYLGPAGQYPYISASDVLNNTIDPEDFENAIVLVGTSSVGLADLRSTPVGTQYPGVEVHANLLNGLLEGVFPIQPVEANNLTGIIILILGFLFTAFSNRLGPFQLTIATIGLLATLVSANLYLWFSANVALPLASSFILTLALGTLHLLEGFLSERLAKQHVTSVFGQYVPSAHISHMLSDPEKYGFEGETREMTVLFSDVRSFTSISENLSASELKDLLNRYFTPITETIFNHQGTIDKYVGDMVMAFWGAPLEDELHAQHALEASVEMLNVLKKLNPQLLDLGYPEIKVGIGLNTGPMNVGDMGSSFRKAYTVLGDAVNLGSRLESLTKFYGIDILVGPETKAQCPDWTFRFIDKIQVKGKHEPVEVFEPVTKSHKISKRMTQEMAIYERAYEHYLNRQWEDAQSLFKELYLSSKRPELYQIYLDRIELLSWQPLPDDWDGTFTHTSK
jgi:adenylate cyclase